MLFACMEVSRDIIYHDLKQTIIVGSTLHILFSRSRQMCTVLLGQRKLSRRTQRV